jgi:hypothetical protein
MAKKLLLSNGDATDSDYIETLTGNPIYISDVKVTDDLQGEVISIITSSSTNIIIIYSSNCPYVFAKGGRINANS